VGCGEGEFLDLARRTGKLSGIGLDLARESIETCERKGLRAYCRTAEHYRDDPNCVLNRFQFVAAFHCLEHVPDPLGFARTLASLLDAGGRLFLSTPYSPMSFEGAWFDVLNYPPHHLTRWNARAYQKLAELLGMEVVFHMPSAGSTLRRAFRSMRLIRANGWAGSLGDGVLAILSAPNLFAKEVIRQAKRERFGGRVAADVVLVEMQRRRAVI
jgi:2-polyprenyl-3-methyl-5-hydroxy-6-metoxy-1,4-benzoquinol methylase